MYKKVYLHVPYIAGPTGGYSHNDYVVGFLVSRPVCRGYLLEPGFPPFSRMTRKAATMIHIVRLMTEIEFLIAARIFYDAGTRIL